MTPSDRFMGSGARAVRLVLVVAAAALMLANCGGDGGGTSSSSSAANLSLFAGQPGGPGNIDGTGAAARFNRAFALATDAAGNVYVADGGNSTIRKITPAGVVTTLAGTAGVRGFSDGTGAAARFIAPSGIATDTAGNVYVSDASYSNTIRRITPPGVVTTLAGTAGAAGSADGTGAAARFNGPCGVATDTGGNVYVADYFNSTIRKITPAGVVTTLAGTAGAVGSADGTGAAASFNGPCGVATDTTGNVYVADSFNNTIRKITPAGVVTTLAGTAGTVGSADGTGAAARLYYPTGVATDAIGNVYVADSKNSTIRKITPAGVVTTLAGTAGAAGFADGVGAAASFRIPFGVATDTAGNVYVADYFNSTIRKITPAGVVTTLAGTEGAGFADGIGAGARFSGPTGVATDWIGYVYVADASTNTIRRITPAGVVTTLAGTAWARGSADGTGVAARFSAPSGVATDRVGNVYVVDAGNDTIRRINAAEVVTTLAGTAGAVGSADGTGAAARFNGPSGVATDWIGNLYVADSYNNTIRKITPAGVVTTLAGTAGAMGSADGTAAGARFDYPTGVATDATGNVYVADSNNNTIRKITPDGVVTTLAGTAGAVGSADGTGAVARFNYPSGVATDLDGNVYVADAGNNTIRKITRAGVVTTLAGRAGQAGFTPGVLPGILNMPVGVAIYGSTLYVADVNENIIAVVTNLP
jgi:D-alanyl-D-alanine dipeptidase